MSSSTGLEQSCIGCVFPSACIPNSAFYYLFKTIIVLWLALPQFRGAQYVYHAFLRPVFARQINQHAGAVPGIPLKCKLTSRPPPQQLETPKEAPSAS
jgi:hypothetical protein